MIEGWSTNILSTTSHSRPEINDLARRIDEKPILCTDLTDYSGVLSEDRRCRMIPVTHQGHLVDKTQIFYRTLIWRINEHIEMHPHKSVSFVEHAAFVCAHARVWRRMYYATVIQQSYLICLLLMLDIETIWHWVDGRLELGWSPRAHLSPNLICSWIDR